jgi:hypothetical protein
MDQRMMNPLTGEVVGDSLDSLTLAEAEVDRDIRALYRFRDELRLAIAEARGVARLPHPRRQTDVQRRVAACPRCGSREQRAA